MSYYYNISGNLFFRYRVFINKELLTEFNLLPFSVNTLTLQSNSGKIVSLIVIKIFLAAFEFWRRGGTFRFEKYISYL